MPLQKEAEAFEVLAQKLDIAFQKGAFGLADALEIIPAIKMQAALYNANQHELLSRFIQAMPSDNMPAEPEPEDAAQTGPESEDTGKKAPEDADIKDNVVPGTGHRIAKARQCL